MTRLQGFGVAIALAVGVAGFWGACKTPAAPGGILLTGQWGSADGRLTATEVNTVFTGSCGSGHTNEPIMQDKHGTFDLLGSYNAGGTSTEARFIGAVGERTVTMRVKLPDSTVAVGPIMLNLGQNPTLASCR
jgi:hypothetical protein